MAFKDGLKFAMDAAGVNHDALADMVGVSRPAVTQWMSGKTAPVGGRLEKIAKALGTTVPDLFVEPADADHIVPGEPFMPIQSEVSAELKAIRERSGLSAQDVADALRVPKLTYETYENAYKRPHLPMVLVQSLSKIFVGLGDPPVTMEDVLAMGGVTQVTPTEAPPRQRRLSPHTLTIPELDVRPQAGFGAEMPELDGNGEHHTVAEWQIPADYLRSYAPSPGDVRIVRIAGDSMEPDYPANERVLVDTSHRLPSPDGIYVLWDGYGLVLKRLNLVPGMIPPVVRISSINPDYPAYERPVSDVKINGRVIGKWVWK